MKTYEITEIERACKVYRVKAESAVEAEERHQDGDSELVDSFGLDGETYVSDNF